MKTLKLISGLFAMFLFLIPGRAQENTFNELETVIKEGPSLFINLRGEIINSNNESELYHSTFQHEKADFVGIGVIKGMGAIYDILYKYEDDPDLKIFTNYLSVISSLKEDGYKVEEFEEERDGINYTGIKALNKQDSPMIEILLSDTDFEVFIYAYEN